MKCSTEPAATPSPVLRCYINSWEIHGGAPRPVVGQPLNGYRIVLRPSEPQDLYGLAALDEDLDVDALPPQIVVPSEAHGAVRRGRLQAQWHVTPSEGPLYDAEGLSGLVVRTRVISLDRQLGVVEGLGPAGEAMEVWSAVPGTLRLREVTGAGWDFDDLAWRTGPSPGALGEVRPDGEDAVLVDLQVVQRPLE